MSEDRVGQIEALVRRVELIPDTDARQTALDLMGAVLDLHGSGLERMMEIVYESGESGKTTIRRLAGDDIVSSLLLLHSLHPDDIATRVQHALGKMHGNAELAGVFGGSVRVRLTAGGCGVKEAVEAAVRNAAPDAEEIVIEEIPAGGFVPLAALGAVLPESV